jgi:hypothetical protein
MRDSGLSDSQLMRFQELKQRELKALDDRFEKEALKIRLSSSCVKVKRKKSFWQKLKALFYEH